MLSRASSTADAKAGLSRASRPSRTMHSSSPIAATASTISLEGCSRSSFLRAGRASLRPIRPRAHAAELATVRSWSPSKPTRRVMTSGRGRAQRQAAARATGSGCRNSDPRTSAGRVAFIWAAAVAAITSVGPCTTARPIIPDTAWVASGPPIAARARRADSCSRTGRSAPKPVKRRQSAARAGTAAASRRRAASAASAALSTRLALGIAAINAASSRSAAMTGRRVLCCACDAVCTSMSEKRSSWRSITLP